MSGQHDSILGPAPKCSEVARFLGVGPEYVYDLISHGRLETYEIGSTKTRIVKRVVLNTLFEFLQSTEANCAQGIATAINSLSAKEAELPFRPNKLDYDYE